MRITNTSVSTNRECLLPLSRPSATAISPLTTRRRLTAVLIDELKRIHRQRQNRDGLRLNHNKVFTKR